MITKRIIPCLDVKDGRVVGAFVVELCCRDLRGGTENTYGIIGLNKAIEYCDLNNEKEMCNKRNYFIGKETSAMYRYYYY